VYDGYVGEEVTRKKLYHSVFQQGDVWWSSGDLLKIDEEGFFYFVDRIGDTFRWKGENVSTNEVSQVLHQFPGIKEANGDSFLLLFLCLFCNNPLVCNPSVRRASSKHGWQSWNGLFVP